MTDKEVFKSMRDDIVEAKSRLEVQTSQHGVAALTTALTQANAALLLALTEPTDDAPAGVLPPEISRELLGQVVDEVFGGAIEDATVIEDIYRVIARSVAPPAREGLNHDPRQAQQDPSGANGAGA
ncbi:hypothetical protein [Pandoraea norimbergensis]|uniref:Uncharacterized protein n=1 Tax=Pandoraea norimbergensis TaxID=93219 RepID=A0ABN4JR96_9BURK|nr:hypothetical protein [Pandoraea norimbergensis]ALS62310.1 hypothetical protein AT302_23480 [Pandoraea norimbergensis]